MSWEDIVKRAKQGPRKKMWMDEEHEKSIDYTYFREKADKMQNALKEIQYDFNILERVLDEGDERDKRMGNIREVLRNINIELREMETYVERLETHRTWPQGSKPPADRVTGTNIFAHQPGYVE